MIEILLKSLPGELIRLRKEKNITQKDLANKLGTKEQVIQRYEKTLYESVALKRLLDIARILESSDYPTPQS